MLYIVPTPIGNLKDITLRALDALKEADLILAEDTRTTSNLLNHYQITKPLSPYHQHNEHKVLQHLIDQLLQYKHHYINHYHILIYNSIIVHNKHAQNQHSKFATNVSCVLCVADSNI